jgi:hypothetical protein
MAFSDTFIDTGKLPAIRTPAGLEEPLEHLVEGVSFVDLRDRSG